MRREATSFSKGDSARAITASCCMSLLLGLRTCISKRRRISSLCRSASGSNEWITQSWSRARETATLYRFFVLFPTPKPSFRINFSGSLRFCMSERKITSRSSPWKLAEMPTVRRRFSYSLGEIASLSIRSISSTWLCPLPLNIEMTPNVLPSYSGCSMQLLIRATIACASVGLVSCGVLRPCTR